MVAPLILVAIGIGVAALGLGLGVAAGKAAKKTEEKREAKERLLKERALARAQAEQPQEYNTPYREPVEPFHGGFDDMQRGYNPGTGEAGYDPNFDPYATVTLPEEPPPKYRDYYPTPNPKKDYDRVMDKAFAPPVDPSQQQQAGEAQDPAQQQQQQQPVDGGDKKDTAEGDTDKKGRKGKKGKKGQAEDDKKGGKKPEAESESPAAQAAEEDVELPDRGGLRKFQIKKEDEVYAPTMEGEREQKDELLKQIRDNDRKDIAEARQAALQSKHPNLDIAEELMPAPDKEFRTWVESHHFDSDLVKHPIHLDFPGDQLGIAFEEQGRNRHAKIKSVVNGRAAHRSKLPEAGYVVAVDDIRVNSVDDFVAAVEHLAHMGTTEFDLLVAPQDPSTKTIWKDADGIYRSEEIAVVNDFAAHGLPEADGHVAFTGEDGAIPEDLLQSIDALHNQWVEEQEGIAAANVMNPDIHRRPMADIPGTRGNAGNDSLINRDGSPAHQSKAFGNSANTYDALYGRRDQPTPGTVPRDSAPGLLTNATYVSPQFAAHEAYVARLLDVRSPNKGVPTVSGPPRRPTSIAVPGGGSTPQAFGSVRRNSESGLPMHRRRVHEAQAAPEAASPAPAPGARQPLKNNTANLAQSLHPLFPHTNHPPEKSPLRERTRPTPVPPPDVEAPETPGDLPTENGKADPAGTAPPVSP